MPWYLFTPIDLSTDFADPKNYTLYGDEEPDRSEENLADYAIRADDNAGLPDISFFLELEISNALELKIDTDNVRLYHVKESSDQKVD